MSKKQQRKQKLKEMTRETIREAVIDVMVEAGPEGLTMARVAEQAGIGKGTLYLYYNHKEELIQDAVNTCFMPLIKDAKDIFNMALPPDQKLRRLVRFHHNFFSENRQLFRMLLIDRQASRSHQAKEENKHYQEIIQSLSALIQQGIDEQIFRKVDAEAAAVIILESNLQLTYRFLSHDSELSFDTDNGSDILQDIFFNGLLL